MSKTYEGFSEDEYRELIHRGKLLAAEIFLKMLDATEREHICREVIVLRFACVELLASEVFNERLVTPNWDATDFLEKIKGCVLIGADRMKEDFELAEKLALEEATTERPRVMSTLDLESTDMDPNRILN